MKTPEMIQVDKLRTFENHPYKVEENEEMEMLTQSIKENGILSPLIVRPKEKTIDELRQELSRLVADEKYEQAAIVRDKIKEMEGNSK